MQSTSEELSSDVCAIVKYLKNRKDLMGAEIGLLGHSEGGLIVFMVAAQFPDGLICSLSLFVSFSSSLHLLNSFSSSPSSSFF
jgi:pimeloyl-ACP methyl ester carboxylesterase